MVLGMKVSSSEERRLAEGRDEVCRCDARLVVEERKVGWRWAVVWSCRVGDVFEFGRGLTDQADPGCVCGVAAQLCAIAGPPVMPTP